MAAKKIQLVLGSGGARGMAHIGVIEGLLENNFEITEVVGCSMGAVIGGIYCSGNLKKYRDWLIKLDKSSVFDLLDFTFTRQGFIKGEKIFAEILEMTGKQTIEDFEIPFTAIATDLMHMKEVHYKTGDLFNALRASISIPGLFLPIYEKDQILVDGGVLNPLPLDLIEAKEDHLIVAVNVNGPASVADIMHKEKAENEKEEFNKNWFEKTFSLPDLSNHNKEYKLSLFELMDTSYNFTQDRLTRMIKEIHPPDLLIEIPRTACDTFDFHEGEKLIRMGRNKVEETMK